MTKKPICKYFPHIVVGIAICAFSAVPRASAAVNLGSSSWVWQNPLPQGNSLQGVACSLAGGSLNLNCIAVGDLGSIIFGTASSGGPLSWTSRTSNTTQTLHAVACVPGSLNCFAVGDGGTILVTWDNGDTWTSRSSGTTAKLLGISCNTTGKAVNCFAVGTEPTTILATNDDGVTWFPQPPPPDSLLALFAVSCPDANTCYAAGNSGSAPTILKPTNGGWKEISLAGLSSGGTLVAISCGSTSNCVAVDTGGNAYWTTDGWTHSASGQFPPVPAGSGRLLLLGVSCWDAADCVAVGGGVRPNLYVSNDAGKTWQGETSGSGSASLNAVSCSGGACLAVGALGEIVTDYPLGWGANLKTTVTNQGLRRVSCVDTNHCWAVGDEGIFATSNGGTTWANQYSAPGILSAISCPSTTACFAVGGLILGTTDGGKTWNTQPPNTTARLNAINCPSTTTCFAAGLGIIMATTDGGKHWDPSLTFGPFVNGPNFSGIVCPSTVSCIAVADNGVIITTFNVQQGPKPWTQVQPLTPNNLLDVSCASASICIAVGQGTALITTDFGKIGPNGQPDQHWSLQPPSTATLMGIGCDFDLGCYATTDDGYILSMPLAAGLASNQEARVDVNLSGLSCAGVSGEDRCVAVGGGGTIVSKAIGPSSPDFSLTLQPLFMGKSLVSGFNVIINLLGPFNGTVKLSCSIPGEQSCTLNPTSVSASGTSLMTGPIDLAAWGGATVTGTSGSLTHTVTYVYNPPPAPPPCKPGVCQ